MYHDLGAACQAGLMCHPEGKVEGSAAIGGVVVADDDRGGVFGFGEGGGGGGKRQGFAGDEEHLFAQIFDLKGGL